MKITLIHIPLLMVTIFQLFFTNTSHAETSESNIMYYIPGWNYPGCGTVSDSFGYTVEEVARQEIEKQNRITDWKCQKCFSPAILVSVDEEAGEYVEKSVCSGISYTCKVSRINAFTRKSNLGPGLCTD